jgi:hypothetical protein
VQQQVQQDLQAAICSLKRTLKRTQEPRVCCKQYVRQQAPCRAQLARASECAVGRCAAWPFHQRLCQRTEGKGTTGSPTCENHPKLCDVMTDAEDGPALSMACGLQLPQQPIQ